MKLRSSHIFAIVMSLGIIAWFWINTNQQPVSDEPTAEQLADAKEEIIPEVVIKTVVSETHENKFELFGRTEAAREVSVKAETAGLVVSTPAKEGSYVKRGTILCRQDVNARQANVDQARALLKTRELELSAAQQLVEKGFRSETQLLTAQAALDSARAGVKQAEIELDNIYMRAPFAGMYDRHIANVGDYLMPGQPCGLLIELDPLIVVAELTETQVGKISTEQSADVKLATGEILEGKVRLIESRANPSTRTFRTEIALPNPEMKLKAGVTATVRLKAGESKAHMIPSQILTLNEKGDIGVRYIDDYNIVKFAATQTIDETPSGIWVTGLPETANIIVQGQDFVRVGTKVQPSSISLRSEVR